jgi:hypothetical protein
VTIAADQTLRISESLYSGWLHVTSPIEIEVAEGGRSIRLDDQNQILLLPGSHDVRFENRALSYSEARKIEVKPGEVTRIVLAPTSKLTVTATLPSEILVDGQRVGEAPLADHAINLGTRDIVVRSTSGDERRFTTTVTTSPVRLDVDFSSP